MFCCCSAIVYLSSHQVLLGILMQVKLLAPYAVIPINKILFDIFFCSHQLCQVVFYILPFLFSLEKENKKLYIKRNERTNIENTTYLIHTTHIPMNKYII